MCSFSSDFVFNTYVPENVFAISHMKINIDTIDASGNIGAHSAFFSFSKNVTFNHFSDVSINNINIKLANDA